MCQYADVAERFLSRRSDRLEFDRPTAEEVASFVVACSRRLAGSMKSVATALRSLLRFLFVAVVGPSSRCRVLAYGNVSPALRAFLGGR